MKKMKRQKEHIADEKRQRRQGFWFDDIGFQLLFPLPPSLLPDQLIRSLPMTSIRLPSIQSEEGPSELNCGRSWIRALEKGQTDELNKRNTPYANRSHERRRGPDERRAEKGKSAAAHKKRDFIHNIQRCLAPNKVGLNIPAGSSFLFLAFAIFFLFSPGLAALFFSLHPSSFRILVSYASLCFLLPLCVVSLPLAPSLISSSALASPPSQLARLPRPLVAVPPGRIYIVRPSCFSQRMERQPADTVSPH